MTVKPLASEATVRIPYNKNEIIFLKGVVLWKAVAFVILLFLGDKKSSKKVVGGHYRLCPPNPPATLLRIITFLLRGILTRYAPEV